MKGQIWFHPDNVELENIYGDSQYELTETVKALYDLVMQSVDWGSCFFSVEDVVPVLKLSELCGFEQTDQIRHYMEQMRGSWEYATFRQKYPGVKKEHWEPWPAAKKFLPGDGAWVHDHVFNSSGECIWSGCYAKGNPDPRILAFRPYPDETGAS